MMGIGEYINKYLTEHGLSFRQFGRMSGISHAYIANIVNGKTSRGNNPVLSIKKLKQIANAMGMDVNQLLREVDVDVAWGSSAEVDEYGDEQATRDSMMLSDEEVGLILAWRKASTEDRQTAAFALRKYGMAVPAGEDRADQYDTVDALLRAARVS